MNRIIIIGLVLISIGCSTKQENDSGKLNVVTTTGMLYDAVINIAGDQVDAQALMGPGVDPHLYKATQGDLAKLNQADLIVYNGLYLEGKMSEILGKLGRSKAVIAAAEVIPKDSLLASIQYEDTYDPHIWFDVNLWKSAVKEISNALIKNDSVNADLYKSNTIEYLQKLDELEAYIHLKIGEIPPSQRILVTAHDAFRYFGRAYGVRVEGLQGISTVSDFGLRDIAEITDMIIENDIKAIFIETSVSDRAINAVVKGCNEQGHDVVIGGYLYSDAMGAFGTEEGSYIGMFKSNVNTLVKALK